MEQYQVTGMSCAACCARVEKTVSKVKGVTNCSVNLLTNSMNVEGTALEADIIKAVSEAGYGATKKGETSQKKNKESDISTTKPILIRLICSIFFWLILMYFSMGHMMWNFPIPSFFEENHVAMGLFQLVLTVVIMVINQKFFISGFKGLLHRAPNMDTLVSLGSMAAFLYSTVILFLMTDAQLHGNHELVMKYMDEFYFESAATILTLITLGKLLEAYSKGKTTNALKSLMNLAPKTATIIIDSKEVEVPIEQVKKDDIFIVRPGESIPVDGVVLEGISAVNESALTGESIPVDKQTGSLVSAGTINQSGFLRCEATKVGEDTTLAQIIQLVSDTASSKAPIAKIADKVSGVFVPTVMSLALITLVVWLLIGKPIGFSLARSISILVISCPCALGLATPVAIMVGSGMGAKNGILFKTAVSLENAGKTKIVVLDKTGTITSGKPKVTDILELDPNLLPYAYALEHKSEHPLAIAINELSIEKKITLQEIKEFEALPGNGLKGILNGNAIYGGNLTYISSILNVPIDIQEKIEKFAEEGKTPLIFACQDKLLGVIAVADVIKEDSPEAIKTLKEMGIRVVMVTGDNEKTARAIGYQSGVDEVISGVLPSGKEKIIRELKTQGQVMMVGDGINDAPALTLADIGVAIGAGTDVAIDAADVVLMKNGLSDVVGAIRLSSRTLLNIKENLFWAFIYNLIGIPLAAGMFGLALNPMFGAMAMSLSSFCVVTNALRLNLYRIYGRRNQNKKSKENNSMEKTMKIKGMMCGHCEARVNKVLCAIEGVTSAEVSHKKGTAIVKLEKEVPNDVLKKAVEDQDYTVVDIK